MVKPQAKTTKKEKTTAEEDLAKLLEDLQPDSTLSKYEGQQKILMGSFKLRYGELETTFQSNKKEVIEQFKETQMIHYSVLLDALKVEVMKLKTMMPNTIVNLLISTIYLSWLFYFSNNIPAMIVLLIIGIIGLFIVTLKLFNYSMWLFSIKDSFLELEELISDKKMLITDSAGKDQLGDRFLNLMNENRIIDTTKYMITIGLSTILIIIAFYTSVFHPTSAPRLFIPSISVYIVIAGVNLFASIRIIGWRRLNSKWIKDRKVTWPYTGVLSYCRI